MKAKRLRGEYIGNYAPYGYLKDPKNRNHLIIDPEIAPFVVEIFEMRAEGLGITAIARRLNERDVPSPGRLRYERGILTNNNKAGSGLLWNRHVLTDLLKNVAYIGNLEQGRSTSCLYKGVAFHWTEKSEWDLAVGTHEPVITCELWERVQTVNEKKAREAKNTYGKYAGLPKRENPYGSLLRCADCGRVIKQVHSYSTSKKSGTSIYYNYKCPEMLSGEEYLRVTTALEDEGYDYFYGFVDIPMTENGVYIKHGGTDLADVKGKTIAKAILFLSCAEGIHLSGEYADDGRVMNLEEVGEALSANEQEEEEKIRDIQQKTEEILDGVMSGLPEEYGEKKTADYFLKWMDENLAFTTGADGDNVSYSGMKDVFEELYIYNNLSAVTREKATALGYAKILSELFNRAGMESHIVRGVWGRSQFRQEGYVLTAVEMNGQTIYIDAGGAKSAELGGQRYLREQEAKNHMKFVEYFDYS